MTDLGYSNKKKFISEVSLLSKYDCNITIFTESEQKTFKVKGSNVLSKFPVRLCGKQVGFKIETDEDESYISNLILNVKLIESENTI